MNYGSREFYEFVFKNNDAEESWEILVKSVAWERYVGMKACAETVYREVFGRLPGELSPEEQLAEDKRTLEKLQRKIEAAEASPKVDPVKDVPVEVKIEEPVAPVVEESKPKQRGRPPRAMTLADLQPK